MKIIDFIKMAFLNLKKRRLRTILNVFAISIGTMLILVMIGLGMGTQNLLYSELKKYDLLNQIYVSPLKEVQNVQISVGSSRGENKKDFKKIITDKDLERMKDINGVEEVIGDVKLMIDEAKVENKGTFFTAFFVMGASFNTKYLTSLKKYENYINGDDNVAILGAKVFESLVKEPKTLIGKYVEITISNVKNPEAKTKEKFKIVGIIEGNSIYENYIILPFKQTLKLKDFNEGVKDYFYKFGYDEAIVKTKSFEYTQDVAGKIKDMGYTVQTLEDALKELNKYFSIFKLILGSVGGIVLFVASIGVLNTMLMAMYERIKFIGILRALGASRKDIRNIFLVESGTIGFLGGVVGVLVGSILNSGINLLINHLVIKEASKPITIFYTSFHLAFLIIVFSVLLASFAGLYPALRASRLDPVEALRYE